MYRRRRRRRRPPITMDEIRRHDKFSGIVAPFLDRFFDPSPVDVMARIDGGTKKGGHLGKLEDILW